MLSFFNIIIILLYFSWCRKNHPETCEPGVSLGEDIQQSTTIIPYLQAHYNRSDTMSQQQFITEHQLNGQSFTHHYTFY